MAEVLEAMGGLRALKVAPANTQEWVQRIVAGLPAQAAWAFKGALGLNNDQLGALLGLSRRSVNRLTPAKAVLPAVAGDRLYRSARLLTLAVDVFEDQDAATEWLKSPQRALGNAVPLDIATTDIGAREVEALLGRIEHGVYS